MSGVPRIPVDPVSTLGDRWSWSEQVKWLFYGRLLGEPLAPC
jgi:hypothetical protein